MTTSTAPTETSKPKNKISLTLQRGKYLISVEARRSRLPIEKPIIKDGRQVGTKTVFLTMLQSTVSLMHISGDIVTYRMTAMGSKVGCVKTTSMPRAMVVNKLATGPDLIPTDTKPVSVKVDQAAAVVARCTGMTLVEACDLFRVEDLLAKHGQEAA